MADYGHNMQVEYMIKRILLFCTTKGKKTLNLSKGAANMGTIFIVIVLTVITSSAFMMIGGTLPGTKPYNPKADQVVAIMPSPEDAHKNLQLLTFSGITVTPTPIPSISTPSTTASASGVTCPTENSGWANEPEILQGFDPGPGGTMSAGGKVRVWVKDEAPPFISQGEVVDVNTGAITTKGDRTGKDTQLDGGGFFLWEPTLYVIPTTQQINANNVYCDATSPAPPCTPHFPDVIKGDYDNDPNGNAGKHGPEVAAAATKGPALDPIGQFQNNMNAGGDNPNGRMADKYFSEYIWDVNALGLQPGTYFGQFVIHDGDTQIAVDCFTIKL